MPELVHPAWLWALAALAVPLVLHLLKRRATAPREFPPAVLLEPGAERAARARRLRELLLLAARMALLAALVLTFARPRLLLPPAEGQPAADRPALALVAVIDDSPSSSRPADPAAPSGPTRLDRALAEARAALAALGPGSEAAAVFASGRSLGPAAAADLAAKLAGPAGGAAALADMGRALAAAPEFLGAMEPLAPAALILSDGEAGALPAGAAERLARRARLAGVDLGAAGVGDDWAVLGARLDRTRLVAGEPAALLARVGRAPGAAPAGSATRRLELVLDGVAVAWREVSLPAGAEAEVELEFAPAAGAHLGELRLAGADNWALNDRLPVALAASAAPPVAVLAHRRELSGAAEAARLALSAGPGAERKAFLAEAVSAEAAALEDFAKFRAFLLVGPPRLPAAVAARLARAAATEGAGIVVLASDPDALNALAAALNLPAPAAAGKPVEFPAPARLAPTEAGAALFEPFKAAARAPVFRRALRLNPGDSRVLARLGPAGGELAGLIERPLGRAAVLVLASGPEAGWSDLARREQAGLFVPLMHELAARAAALPEAELAAGPGATVDIRVAERERAARLWLVDAAGLRVPAGAPDAELRVRFQAPERPGAWRVISEIDGAPAAERALAVRLPPEELAGRREPAERLSALAVDSAAALGRLEADRRTGRELTAPLALLALALVAVELLAARLAAPVPPAAPGAEAPARAKRGRAGS
jgi:hypothetical protein